MSEQLRAARALRRAMLGDAYVDGMTADPDPVAAEFQDHITAMAWGVWAAAYCGAPAALAARREVRAVRAARQP
ncbi:MAG TPA: hypothetical protein VFI47_15500 [Acidimicrobiales bacterium]|nr:hypothetical protein [Acidimicrobiales bacterium]